MNQPHLCAAVVVNFRFSARDPAETLLDTVRWLRAHVLGTESALLTP